MITQSHHRLTIEVIIKSHYPCHVHNIVKLRCVVDDVPQMKFDRTCPRCKKKWVIEVKQTTHILDSFIYNLVWTQT